jgi:hypothetical protein
MATDGCILKAVKPLSAHLASSEQVGTARNKQASGSMVAVPPAFPIGGLCLPPIKPTSNLVPSEEPTSEQDGGSNFSPLLISHKVLRDPTLRTIGSRSTTIGPFSSAPHRGDPGVTDSSAWCFTVRIPIASGLPF